MQLNITIPDDWKPKLDRLARKRAYEEDRDITYLDIIRDVIRTQCGIVDERLVAECKEDCVSFIKKYIKIRHPFKGLIDFDMYDYQAGLVKFLYSNRFGIIKHFRQGGFTTTALAYALWKCLHFPDQKILYFAKTDREARNAKHIIDTALENLPTEISPIALKDNTHEYLFGNMSQMYFGTPECACGRSITQLIVDQAAFIKNMDSWWKSIYPTLSTGGSCAVLSSSNGLGNWFQKTYIETCDENTAFKIFPNCWRDHPEYNTPEWEKKTREVLGEKGWQQEIEAKFI